MSIKVSNLFPNKKEQNKWEPHHFSNGRSEVLIEPVKYVFTYRSLLPWSGHFLGKTFITSLYFDTTKLNSIYFLVFPSKGSTPTIFRLIIDYIQLPHMSKDSWSDGTENRIIFDEDNPLPYVVSNKPIKCHFPTPGLVVLHCRIINDKGEKPLDKNGKEILVAQRTLSGEIGRGYHFEPLVNEGQIPIIVVDYHQKVLINLTWVLIVLTGILCGKELIDPLKTFVKWILWVIKGIFSIVTDISPFL